MKSKEKYERILCGRAYEDAMETADALIADKKFDELDALVEAAANQGRVSYLTDIGLSLIDADEASKGFEVAILAACVTDRGWPENCPEKAVTANPDSEGETLRLLLDAYSTTGDIETLHSFVNFAYLKALAIAECAPFAARRLAQELLPFHLGAARLLLEEAVADIDGQQGAEAEVAIELLKETEDILASDGPNLTVKCR